MRKGCRILRFSGRLLGMANDPVLIAYTVKRLANGKSAGTRVGAAFPHESGAGLSVALDAAPFYGRIVLLELGREP